MKHLLLIALLLTSCGSPSNGTAGDAAPTFTGLPLTDEQKAEVVRQIKETNALAPKYGIANPKLPGYYIVDVRAASPETCDDPHSMAERVTELFYDQTPADKDREPGKVLLCYSGRFQAPNKIIITAEAISDQVARFESEHLAAWHGNQALYEETKYHAPTRPHPIFK